MKDSFTSEDGKMWELDEKFINVYDNKGKFIHAVDKISYARAFEHFEQLRTHLSKPK